MKITTTAGTLKKGDKVGNRVVRYSTFREYNLGYHVYFEDDDIGHPYGRNEPITVELANPGGWFIRHRKTKNFWNSPGTCWDRSRGDRFEDEQEATDFVTAEIKIGKLGEYDVEVVFLQ